jgi:NIMA (never in mitosis gene a)-related kinase
VGFGQSLTLKMSLSNFEILGRIGRGAFSTVYKARRSTDSQIYALKQVKISSLSPKEKQQALNEVHMLASITHPNIIAYKEAFFDKPSGTL